MDFSALDVLNRYPSALRGFPVPLGNHGGFSGARLWRIQAPAGAFCLKVWPTDGRSRAELIQIHRLMAKADGFAWMPRVMATRTGETLVVFQDRFWELTTWMPGRADFASVPSRARLESACGALAILHQTWANIEAPLEICPAVVRRWQSWQRWKDLLQSGWRPLPEPFDPYAVAIDLLFPAVQRLEEQVPRRLTPWLNLRVPSQPCVCDPWHDHILFTGDTLTGLIDFGSVKTDNVAVDLGRLLGSLIGDDTENWHIGISSYRGIRPLSDTECRLAHNLDRTGTILAATHWLRWLYHDRRHFEQPSAVLRRLEYLTKRLSVATT
jgi:Ser/Thr protein kinase RdoA (MazF antagonist)